MNPANKSSMNNDAKNNAVSGIINPETKLSPQGTTLYRLASTLTKKYADRKGIDQRPLPENHPTLEAYEAADKEWMSDNSAGEVFARLYKGPWWFGSNDLVDFKHASIENGVPLSNYGRQALAVAQLWNNAEFLIEATVKPAGGLEAYCGKGRTQTVKDPSDGLEQQLIADANVLQLYIPGMHVIENARAWFKLEHRHRLRRG